MVLKTDGGGNTTVGSTPTDTQDDIYVAGGGDDLISPRQGDDTIYGDALNIYIPTPYYSVATAPSTVGFTVDTQFASDFDRDDAVAPTETVTITNSFGTNVRLYYVNTDGELIFLQQLQDGLTYNYTLPEGSTLMVADTTSLNQVQYVIDTDQTTYGDVATGFTIPTMVEGNDDLRGGAGADTIYGGGGDDTIYGGARATATATGDQDTVGTGNYDDFLDGGAGNDTIYGDVGNDLIQGGTGIDTIFGEGDDDSIVGGADGDIIDGGAGNDTIHGDYFGLLTDETTQYVADYTSSSLGSTSYFYRWEDQGATYASSDIYRFTQTAVARADLWYVDPDGSVVFVGSVSNGNFTNIELPDGASLFYTDSATGQVLGYIDALPVVYDPLDPAGTSINISQFGNITEADYAGAADTISGGEGDDLIYSEIGDDIVTGDAGADRIYAGSGADTVEGGQGQDFISGQDGADTIYGDDAGDDVTGDIDFLLGGAGNDTLYGQAGADTVSGGSDDDFIDGGIGDDSLSGNSGADEVHGGEGNDYIIGDGAPLVPIPGTSATVEGIFSSAAGSPSAIDDATATTSTVTFENPTATRYDMYYVDPDGTLQFRTGGLPGTSSRSFTVPEGSNWVAVDRFTGEVVGYYANVTGTVIVEPNTDYEQFLGAAGADTLYGDAGDDYIDGQDEDDTLLGGSGDDTLIVGRADNATGNADRDTFIIDTDQTGTSTTITIDGSTESTAADDLDDYDVIDLDASGLTVVSKSSTLDADGNSRSGTMDVTDGTTTFTINFTEIEEIICFVRGTMIETIDGLVAIEALKTGDLVRTKDNGYKPIEWIGARALSSSALKAKDTLYPIRIAADSLGAGYPSTDLYVSPQHRVLVKSKIAERMFGTDEALIPAKKLLLIDGIDYVTDFDEVEYFHFLLDQHEIVFANGTETETLFTGPEALKAVGAAARKEILTLFPELATRDYAPIPARMIPSGRLARKLVHRHKKNNKELFRGAS